jgi:hypothetical protein
MPNDAHTQQRLATDQTFQGRVRAAIATVAFQVLEEDPGTPAHSQRVGYARGVIGNLTGAAQSAASWLVERPNLVGATTSYDFPSGAVITAATDADLESQIMTDWNILAGV